MDIINKNKISPITLTSSEMQKTLHKNLEFTATEQYKLLRTNLRFTIPENVKCPIIGVTSSMRGEGKSTTSINLAYVLAENGNRVLLMDGDLRLPSVAKKMKLKSSPGLTDLLMGEGVKLDDFKTSVMDNWYILPSGDIPPNPSELLGSRRMEAVLKTLSENFDYIVIDLPPVNIVSDAISISPMLTGMVVVVREDFLEKRELEQCVNQLKLAGVKVLGFVMNESGSRKNAYGRYRRYKYYKYYKSYAYTYGYGDNKKAVKKK